MFARYFAARRVRRANAAFKEAYQASVGATERQDTRTMGFARLALIHARHEQMAAEVALARLETQPTFRRA